jgi:hypothetical protein
MEKHSLLTDEEFAGLEATINEIGAYLPENKAPYIWHMFNKLRDEHEPQPCTCASSGHHWKRAMDYLYNYVKENK